MKGVYLVDAWIEQNGQRPLVADEYPCSCEDVTGQYVRLDKGSPNPNMAVFKVVELRSPKHDGRIEAIKKDARFCVLEEWDVPAEGKPSFAVHTVSDMDVKEYLVDKGVEQSVRNKVQGEHRTGVAVELFKDFEKPKPMQAIPIEE